MATQCRRERPPSRIRNCRQYLHELRTTVTGKQDLRGRWSPATSPYLPVGYQDGGVIRQIEVLHDEGGQPETVTWEDPPGDTGGLRMSRD